MSSSSTGVPPQTGSTAARLAYRVFTAKRPGITRDVPPGHESLMWVANSATREAGDGSPGTATAAAPDAAS